VDDGRPGTETAQAFGALCRVPRVPRVAIPDGSTVGVTSTGSADGAAAGASGSGWLTMPAGPAVSAFGTKGYEMLRTPSVSGNRSLDPPVTATRCRIQDIFSKQSLHRVGRCQPAAP
jgi:hypothetical protein